MSAQPTVFTTPEQYVEREASAEYKSEYLCGQICAMAGGSIEHSAISSNIGAEMSSLLKRGSCQVFNSDLHVTVMQSGLKTYPDVTVVCGEQHRHLLDKKRIINPTVLFELLSPSTETYDRREKWAFYRRLDSLREYILVSQNKAFVEQYVRQGDGSWKFTAVGSRGKPVPSCPRLLPVSFGSLWPGAVSGSGQCRPLLMCYNDAGRKTKWKRR